MANVKCSICKKVHKKINRKKVCSACYNRQWRKENPEKYLKQIERNSISTMQKFNFYKMIEEARFFMYRCEYERALVRIIEAAKCVEYFVKR